MAKIMVEILGEDNAAPNKKFYAHEEAQQAEQNELSQLELTIIKVLLINPPFVEQLLDMQDIMQSSKARKIMNIMFELYGTKEDFDSEEVMERLDPEESRNLAMQLDKIIIAGNEDKVFTECITKWKLDKLLTKEKQLIDRLSLSDEEIGGQTIKELTEELSNYTWLIDFLPML